MLVLSRREGEHVIVGDDTVVTVEIVSHDKVGLRIQVTKPSHVETHTEVRKLDEVVRFDNGSTVRVVQIERGKIRLGFSAPRSLSIARPEILSTGDPRLLMVPGARPIP